MARDRRSRPDWPGRDDPPLLPDLGHALFEPHVRLTLAGFCAFALAVVLLADGLARWERSPIFPVTTGELWLAVGLGAAIGVAMAVTERFQLIRMRANIPAFQHAPPWERRQWKHLKWNLLLNGWYILLVLAVPFWFAALAFSQRYAALTAMPPVLPPPWSLLVILPAGLAAIAVRFAGNFRLVGKVQAELTAAPPRP